MQRHDRETVRVQAERHLHRQLRKWRRYIPDDTDTAARIARRCRDLRTPCSCAMCSNEEPHYWRNTRLRDRDAADDV